MTKDLNIKIADLGLEIDLSNDKIVTLCYRSTEISY